MMSWWRLLSLVVLLLPLVSTQDTPPPFTPPPAIDFEKVDFGSGNAYFARKDQITLEQIANSQRRTDDVTLHTIKRGHKKLVIEIDIRYIQEKTDRAKLDEAKAVKIIQGPFTLECNPGGSVTATESGKSHASITIVDRGDLKPRVSFTKNRIYCWFIIKSDFKISDNFVSNDNKPSLQFGVEGGTTRDLVYSGKNRELWEEGSSTCDPDLPSTFPNSFESSGVGLEPLKDLTNVKCDKGRLYVVEDLDLAYIVDDIKCEDGFWWKVKGTEPPVKLNEPFTVMCGVKSCALCQNLPPIECKNPYTCKDPEPVNAVGDDCVNIKCDHKRWFLEIDGRNEWVDTPTLECVQNANGHSVWQANGVDVTKGSCTEDYDCFIHSPLILDCTSTHAPCLFPIKEIINGTQKIVCDPGFKLKVCEGNKCEGIGEYDNLDCDKKTGLFSYGMEKINRISTIGCYETEESIAAYHASLESPATGSIDILFAPIAVIGVLALIALAVGVFFLMKHRKEPPLPPPQESVVVPPVKKAKRKRRKGKRQSGSELRQSKHKKYLTDIRKQLSTGNSSSGSVQSGVSKKSSQSTQSNNSKKRANRWPKDFRRHKFNRNRVIPPMDKCEINKTNAYPCPRFASKCPDEYSTSMDIQNPRLVELLNREKATTVSKSVQNPEGDGKGAPANKKTPK